MTAFQRQAIVLINFDRFPVPYLCKQSVSVCHVKQATCYYHRKKDEQFLIHTTSDASEVWVRYWFLVATRSLASEFSFSKPLLYDESRRWLSLWRPTDIGWGNVTAWRYTRESRLPLGLIDCSAVMSSMFFWSFRSHIIRLHFDRNNPMTETPEQNVM